MPTSSSDGTPAAAAPTAADGVAGLSFEQALAELERIVQSLERGQLDLEAAIDAYSRGSVLRRHCEAKLRDARMRVEQITLDGAGQVTGTRPFDEPSGA